MSQAGLHCCAGKSRPAWHTWLLALLLTGLSAQVQAQTGAFVELATVSGSAVLASNSLCYTDSRDIACDGAAGQVTTSGTLQIPNLSTNAIGVVNVSATGNIQANQFIGDGSGLTGVVASSADRITSGTTSFVVVSETGYISLTQGGTNTGWFDPTRGLVTLGVSATGSVSATSMVTRQVFGLVGGLATQPTYSWISDNNTGIYNPGNGVIGFATNGVEKLRITTSLISTANIVVAGTGSAAAPTFSFSADPDTGVFRVGVNTLGITTNAAQRMVINSSGLVGIALSTPTTALEVGGTISSTGISVTGIVSATRFEGQFVGDGSGLTGVVAARSDQITSGTTSFVVVSETGYISLTQGGTNTGWFDPTLGLVTLGVSATGGISGTTGYFSGNVGIGTSSPNARLNVSGSARFNNNVSIGVSGNTAMTLFSANSLGANPDIQFWASGGIAAEDNMYFYIDTDNNSSNNRFIFRNNTALSNGDNNLMVLTENASLSLGVAGVGSLTPSASLHISGTAMVTSWTAIGANVTATTALDVYGTISATGVSVSGIVTATQIKLNSPTAVSGFCETSEFGTIRLNPVSGRMQICRPRAL
jgi:hypothetical protein